MNNSSKIIYSFLAGAALGILAASLISKEDREKMASKLKEKANDLRTKLAAEMDALKAEMNNNKTA
jgi:hypothetical protein